MKRELVLAEWRRAQQAMGSAELLTREGYHADAIGRTYYALFHAAKAALHVQDVSADTHTGVRRMFGLHLIKPGQIEPEWSSPLGETFDERLAADYDPEMSFSAREAPRCLPAGQGVCRAHPSLSAQQRFHRLSVAQKEEEEGLKRKCLGPADDSD